MSNFKVDFPNLDKVIKKLKGVPDAVDKEFAKTLFTELEEVAGRSKESFVPVDTGALRGTLHVTTPIISRGNKVFSSIAAGGPSAPYALAVHENLSPSVRWSVPGTGPKYIETPLNEAIPRIKRELDRAIARGTKKGLR